MKDNRFTCPCCGNLTFGDWPGSYDICHVCFWEDDLVQLVDPWSRGGANAPALAEAQNTFAHCGAMEERFLKNVKGLLPSDERDPTWRKVIASDRPFARIPRDLSDKEMEDLNSLYYWRQNAA